MHFYARRAAPGERPWRPASAPASGRTCAARARQLPTSCSWAHPRAIGHHEVVGLHLLIAQLPAGIVNEHIVQCRVLDRERLDLHFGAVSYTHLTLPTKRIV